MIPVLFANVVWSPRAVGLLCRIVGDMPNVETKVLDKGVFWDTRAEAAGLKLQRNWMTSHWRIIDAQRIRHAWGSEKAMRGVLEALTAELAETG